MAFVDDSFTDTDGTLLENHTGETGATWTKHPSYSAALNIDSGGVAKAASGTSAYYASGIPASPEYDVVGVLAGTAVSAIGLCARMSTSANTFYHARFRSGMYEFFKCVNGSFTSLGTYTIGADSVPVTLEMRDAAKRVLADGVELLSSPDNAITDTGRAGLRDGSSGSSVVTWLSFTATDAGGGSSPISLSGTAEGQTQTDAQVLRQLLMQAQAQGSGSATAALQALRNLEAVAAGSGDAQAALLVRHELNASAAGAGAAEAAIRLARQLSGISSGTGSAEATPQVGSGLSGTAQGSGSTSASVLVTRFLHGIGSGQGSGTAATFRELRLTAEAGGIGQAEGQLVTDAAILLAAIAQGSSGAEAEASVERLISASVDGSGAVQAVLAIERLIAGSVLGLGGATGTLVVAGTRVVIESSSDILKGYASTSAAGRAYVSSSTVRQIII